MQALKALVIFMGVLIFAGMGLLVYGLLTRVGVDDDGEQATAVMVKPFGLVEATLPAGATVADVSVETGRATVQVRLPDGGVELHVFDLATGAAHGTVRLKVTP